MIKAQLMPEAGNMYRIVYSESGEGVACNFGDALLVSQKLESEGEIEKACNVRFGAFQSLMELIPDSTDLELDWDDTNSREAMLLISFSAIDHFLAGDFEMCAAMLEMLLELDPEDHLEMSTMLGYSYIAIEEYELFDEVINDVSDKRADKAIQSLWSEFRRRGEIPEGELKHFKKNFPAYYREFTADDHPVDEDYLKGLESERPSHRTLARELWLQTEHLWTLFPEFIETLKKDRSL